MRVRVLRRRCECCIKTTLRGVAQLGRAPGLGPGGRMFKSCRPDHIAFSPREGSQIDRVLGARSSAG